MAALAKIFGRSDNSIRDAVLAEFKWDPKIASNDITVAVKDGVVTLAGFRSQTGDVAHRSADRQGCGA